MSVQAWNAPAPTLGAALAWGLDHAEGAPLVVSSAAFENVDALSWVHHGRPVAFLFPQEMDQIDRIAEAHQGQPIFVLSIEQVGHGPPAMPGHLTPVDSWQEGGVAAQLHQVPGAHHGGPPDEASCVQRGLYRGTCLQRIWLDEGPEAAGAWMRQIGGRADGWLRPGRMAW
jgi:hypothetical protein